MIYLASPYSHPDEAIRRQRFVSACLAAGNLMDNGHVVFCPIAHSHPIAVEIGERDHAFWMAQDLPFLALSSRLFVLQLDGWEKSKGVAEEMAFAKERGIPIEFVL